MSFTDDIYTLPSRLISTFEYMHYLGEKGANNRDIIEKLESGGNEKSASMISSVLKVMVEMKLLEEESNNYKIREEYFNFQPSRNELRSNLYKVLLKILTDENAAKESVQGDVPFYIAIFLCFDPYEPVLFGKEIFFKMVDQLLEEKFEPISSSKFKNANHVGNFTYWMHYLGFASKGFVSKSGERNTWPTYFFPDPTEAIAGNLNSIFSSTKKMHIEDFQKSLAESLPVLEGGSVRNIVENKTKGNKLRKENNFSKSTSLALKRLDLRGLINFDTPSDDLRDWYLNLGKGNKTERVTYVEYSGGINV